MCRMLYISTPICFLDPDQSKAVSCVLLLRLLGLSDAHNINTEQPSVTLIKVSSADWSSIAEHIVRIIGRVRCMPPGFTPRRAWQISLSGFIALLFSIAWSVEDITTLSFIATSIHGLLNFGMACAVHQKPLERVVGLLALTIPHALNKINLENLSLLTKDFFWAVNRSIVSAVARAEPGSVIKHVTDNQRSKKDFLIFCHCYWYRCPSAYTSTKILPGTYAALARLLRSNFDVITTCALFY